MPKGTSKSELDGKYSSKSSLAISYTSRTQRVSKAKKGKRVHPCKFSECDKIFTRAEHKRRHEMRHNLKKLYHCTHYGCMVAFENPENLISHMEKSEHDSVDSQSTEGSLCPIVSETTSNTRSESTSLPPTSHPNSTTKGGKKSNTPTIATAEWINYQTYRPENSPIHEDSFALTEMSASISTEALPTLVDQMPVTFAGQIQDICYGPGGLTTVSSFQGIDTAFEYQMKSQPTGPLQYSQQTPLWETLPFMFPNSPFTYSVPQEPWMVQDNPAISPKHL